MARAWQLVIKASADDREAKKALRELGSNANQLGRSVSQTFGKIAKASAIALGAGLVATVAVGVKELGEMQKASAQTAAVLKSTAGAAGVTRQQVESLAGAIARKSGLDDQAIQTGQNLLLTFTNIRNEAGKGNDIFNQSTQIMADMSVALGQDAKASALQLGKALNDPVKGVTALQRVGVSFTADQKEQIKALTESGQRMKAQKLILAELGKEFGGSAAAYGKTLPGMIGRIKESFAGAAATIVGAFLPAITKGATKLSELVAKMQAWADSDKGQAQLAQLRDILTRVGDAIGSVIGFIVKHRDGLMTLGAAVLAGVAAYKAFLIVDTVAKSVGAAIVLFKAWRAGTLAQTAAQMGLNAALIANPIGLIVVGIAALVAGVIVAYKKVGWFRDGVNAVWSWIKGNWPKLLVILTGPIGLAVMMIVKHWAKIKSSASSVWTAIKNGVSDAIGYVRTHWKDILAVLTGPLGIAVRLVTKNWDSIRDAASTMVKNVVDRIGDMVSAVKNTPGRITSAARGMFNGVKDAFRSAINWIIGKWNSLSFGIDAVKVKGKTVLPGVKVNTPDLPYMARGGRVTQPAIIGEDGDEQIVPLSAKYRKDGIRNLLEAAAAMGVPMYAKGKKPKRPKPSKKGVSIPVQNGVSLASADVALASAEGTEDQADDRRAYVNLRKLALARLATLRTFYRKNLKRLTKDQRAETLGEIASAQRLVNQYNDAIKQIDTPPDTGTDDASSGGTDTGAGTGGSNGGTDTGGTSTTGGDASGGALTGVDISAVLGDGSTGSGKAFVNASQLAAGQTIIVNQQFTSEPNMGVAAQSAAWTFRTVMAGAPGAAA